MKKQEEIRGLRGKLMVTGTLAMFAMGTLPAKALAAEKDEKKPAKDEGAKAEAPGQVRQTQVVSNFDIPAGPLTEVAAAFEKATGLRVTLASERLAGVSSPGVKGVMTAQEAFTAALAGTGVSANFLSQERVTLNIQADSQSVTVTAQSELASPKYTAPLRDLPMTLTIIPEGVIENTASTSLVEALRTVSGITFGAGEGGNPVGDRPFIRGVDSQASTFVDGMRDIGSQSREVFNLESVEISKGPSSTYAGRGTAGGSLNLNTKTARRERFLTGNFSPGTAGFYRGTLDGNATLTKWAAGRINGAAQDSGVAGRDYVHSGRYGFAPALNFNVTKRGRLDVNYYDLTTNDLPDPGIPYNNPTFFARIDGRTQVLTPGDGQPVRVNRNNFYGITSRDFRKEKVKTVLGRAEFTVREGTVLRNTYRFGKSNQDYVYSQADDSQGNIYYGLLYRRALQRLAFVDTSINQTDLSGHFKTGSAEHTFAAGMEFSRERSWNNTYTLGVPTFTVRNAATGATTTVSGSRCPLGAGAAGGYFCTDLFAPTPNDPFTGVVTGNNVTNPSQTFTNTIIKNNAPTKQRSLTSSLYGFDTVRFLPQLQGTFGIRYDHYDSMYRTAIVSGASTTYRTINGLVNYQAALSYKPKTAVTLYGSVNSSSTPPGNSLSQGSDASAITSAVNQTLPPETTRSEEGGVKWELFGAKALATAAYFQADTENVRITLADSSIAAAGKRRNRGLDFSLSGYVNRRWQVFGGYTFMNAILVDAGGAGTASGLMNGRRFPNTPENSFSITTYYSVTRKLNLGGGVYGVGKVFGNDSPTAPKWVPGYARLDTYGSYRLNKYLELQGNLQNVTNKTYFLQAYTTHYAALAPGRQGRLTLNVRF